ncbi:polysaccharide biosynthesis protein [Galbibacter marinus]|uniref:Polysaccharide biosynthesis protein n=1 Tax=Galbibacter marinus TaxID=555500 RepID=K2PSD6_9FLAO|nr:oligosaccharide flippase family protein [Galbibacter marinus]EKF54444.1 polysaccharide biosynthesis protein [Galbibacter marinus]
MKEINLLKNISGFAFFNVLNSTIPFLLLPVLTAYLSPEHYGVVDIFYNTTLIITPVIGLCVVQSIGRFYFEKIVLSKFVSTVLVILLSSGLIITALSLVFNIVFEDYLLSYDIPPYLIFLAFLYTLFTQISEILLALWRVSYKVAHFGIFRVSKTALDLGLSIFLIVSLGYGWQGRIYPQVVVAFIFAAIALYLLFRLGYLDGLKADKTYKKEALSYSVPLIFHTFGGYVINFSDRFFILLMLSMSDVGIYSVAYQIGMVISLVQNSFNQAWVPFFFQKLNENTPASKRKIVQITYIYIAFLIVMTLLIYLLIPVIYKYFINESYSDGASLIIWVLLGFLFNGIYKMLVNFLFYDKRTRLVAVLSISSASLNIVLNYFLIKFNGITGAAQATMLTFLFFMLVILYVTLKSYKMPWNLK